MLHNNLLKNSTWPLENYVVAQIRPLILNLMEKNHCRKVVRHRFADEIIIVVVVVTAVEKLQKVIKLFAEQPSLLTRPSLLTFILRHLSMFFLNSMCRTWLMNSSVLLNPTWLLTFNARWCRVQGDVGSKVGSSDHDDDWRLIISVCLILQSSTTRCSKTSTKSSRRSRTPTT